MGAAPSCWGGEVQGAEMSPAASRWGRAVGGWMSLCERSATGKSSPRWWEKHFPLPCFATEQAKEAKL